MIIKDEEIKAKVLSALADEHSRLILMASNDRTMSAADLSRECNIPLATVYRRTKDLLELGLLMVVRHGRTSDGKWYEVYRSAVRGIDIRFEHGVVSLEVHPSGDAVDRLTRLWTALRGAGSRSNWEISLRAKRA